MFAQRFRLCRSEGGILWVPLMVADEGLRFRLFGRR
jgi:hypothetical protein